MARHALIACEVFYREFCTVMARTSNTIDVRFVSQGLHDRKSANMAATLQQHVDEHDGAGFDAILLGYGLCNNGISGVKAGRTPLVVTRAHDCITLFMGNRQRYAEHFSSQPGSYYLTSGWIERARRSIETLPTRGGDKDASDTTYQDYVEKFGEDNAKFLMEAMGGWKSKYKHMVFIDLSLGDVESLRRHAREEAQKRDLEFQEMKGDLRLFQGLVDGPDWDAEEYLLIPPGHQIQPSYEDTVLEARLVK